MDTKAGIDEFFAPERKSRRGGFGSREVENRDKDKLKSNLEQIQRFDETVQEEVVGEPVEFGIDPLFQED